MTKSISSEAQINLEMDKQTKLFIEQNVSSHNYYKKRENIHKI